MERTAGVLLSIFSLPGEFGMGTIKDAYPFLENLAEASHKCWQILPEGTVGESFSPYKSYSAFAGNPLFVSPRYLFERRLITKAEMESARLPLAEEIDYPDVIRLRTALLRAAFMRNRDTQTINAKNGERVREYCMFAALRRFFSAPLSEWPEDIKRREPSAMERYSEMLSEEIAFREFMQACFFDEWTEMKKHAEGLGIKIIGDIPIYISEDSADVWEKPEGFLLDDKLRPMVSAGMPPDSFSTHGQHWGNPIYDYKAMEKDGFSWWRERIRHAFEMFGALRIDHFRGFDEYFEITDNGSPSEGVWKKGPGRKIADAICSEASGQIIAEDLGGDTEGVRALLDYSGFPGMRVLEFGFDSDGHNSNLPHMYPEGCAAYTGTHDNDTVMGWYHSVPEKQRKRAEEYLGLNEREGINFGFIRGVLASRAGLAVIPMQDYLGLDSGARMNIPGTAKGNWLWRMTRPAPWERMRKMAKLFGRS